jgi:hypothetical protein
MFRVEVTTVDGEETAVTIQVNDHRADASKATLSDIKRRFRLESREQVLEVLESWTPEQLREHLGQFTKNELKPPAYRR